MRNRSRQKFLWGAAVILALAGGIWLLASSQNGVPGKYNAFATCLKDKGAIFYGAFWCPHCQNQKKMFGSSVKLLPYVECSNPDGQSQNLYCTQKGIKSYPTWEFKDGSRLEGEIPLAQLADKTGCELPK